MSYVNHEAAVLCRCEYNVGCHSTQELCAFVWNFAERKRERQQTKRKNSWHSFYSASFLFGFHFVVVVIVIFYFICRSFFCDEYFNLVFSSLCWNRMKYIFTKNHSTWKRISLITKTISFWKLVQMKLDKFNACEMKTHESFFFQPNYNIWIFVYLIVIIFFFLNFRILLYVWVVI